MDEILDKEDPKTAVSFLDRSVDQIQPESHQLVTFALEVQSEKNKDKNHGGGRGLRKRRRRRSTLLAKLNGRGAERPWVLIQCECP